MTKKKAIIYLIIIQFIYFLVNFLDHNESSPMWTAWVIANILNFWLSFYIVIEPSTKVDNVVANMKKFFRYFVRLLITLLITNGPTEFILGRFF